MCHSDNGVIGIATACDFCFQACKIVQSCRACLRAAGQEDGLMDARSEHTMANNPEAFRGAGHESAFSNQVKTINLALQGGGAHGAFTWGVLDRLLDEEHLSFEGLSATSAGAMNAAVFAYGLAVDGREGARNALTCYWKRVSDAARL